MHFNTMMPLSLILQAGGGGAFGGMVLFLPLLLLIVYMFYSQQRRQKKWQGMLEQLKTGDKVTTSGGLRGTVMALKDDAVHLRVPPNNLVLEVTKASVVQVSTTEEEVKTK
ncbi:MAG TPA: preprotein translocase subunit YajC [Candidatus Sulfotelmatobacter sp.]|nr:preprotein translocase subunit YajC [Candidatus Sulfotelmatobacter sp.]